MNSLLVPAPSRYSQAGISSCTVQKARCEYQSNKDKEEPNEI